MDLVIRVLREADLDALLSLYEQLHPEDEALPVRPIVEQLWRRILEDPTHVYVGGFVGDALVSACNAAIIPNLTRGARPYAVVENVVTDERYRRQGIGSRVLKRLLNTCWERRCYKVMLMSATRRAAIHDFYVSLGFDKASKQAFVMTAPVR